MQEKDFTGEMEQIEDSMYNHSARDNIYEAVLTNLQKMVGNKEALFSKAFVKENLTLNIDDDNVSFDWFQITVNPDEVSVNTEFVSKFCDRVRKVKRVIPIATENDNDNDKYAFRCFLLRLGFIGDEYKKARKVLLKNLTGNSAFRYDK